MEKIFFFIPSWVEYDTFSFAREKLAEFDLTDILFYFGYELFFVDNNLLFCSARFLLLFKYLN